MNILSVILGLVLSLTVNSRTSVVVEGPLPESTSVLYGQSATSGQFGQMTAGNWCELQLIGWQGVKLKRIDLLMRSNQQSGSGSVTVTSGQQVLWTIPTSSFKDWCGAYSTEPIKFRHTFDSAYVVTDALVSIRTEATQNSLYIISYQIEYEPVVKVAHQVLLHSFLQSDTTLIETAPGAGVVLPIRSAYDPQWAFAGWCDHPLTDTTSAPSLISGAEVFYPDSDMELWAVYTNSQLLSQPSTIVCQTGYYALGFQQSNTALRDAVNTSGTILMEELPWTVSKGTYTPSSAVLSQMIYHIDFTDSTALIQHYKSGKPIGHNTQQLAAEPTLWHYQVLSDSTITFYTPSTKGKVHTLYVSPAPVGRRTYGCLSSFSLASLSACQWILFPLPDPTETYTWSICPSSVGWPSIRIPSTSTKDALIRIGLWEMHIHNGKKTMVIAPNMQGGGKGAEE